MVLKSLILQGFKSFPDRTEIKFLGGMTAIVGPNGSGKTTTINMISGVIPADSGSIVYKGTEVSGRSTDSLAKMGIIRTFQNIKLFTSMSALENTMVGGHSFTGNTMAKSLLDVRAHFREEKLLKEAAEEAMEYVGLYSVRNENVRNLPYGKQKMLELARALMSKPQLLLLDEPLSNLDAKLRIDMRAELQRLHKELGTTIIYVTHDQTEALTMSTKIALFKAGELNQVATPTELYNNPIDLEAADFIGNPRINLLDGKAEVINGQLVVKSDLGGHTFPAEHLTSEEFPKSGEFDCVLAIRPEQIAISTQPVEGAIPVTIYANQPAGSETITTLKAGTDEFLAKDIGQIRYDLDQKVWAIIDQDKINIYNKETTRLIKRAV